jgi:uncharacterized membrane protein
MAFASVVALVWVATGAALSTRYHLVFTYETLVTVPASLEILAVSSTAFVVLSVTGLLFPALVYWNRDEDRCRYGLACGLVASLPLGLVVLRCASDSVLAAGIWEVVWFAVFTGLSIGLLANGDEAPLRLPNWLWHLVLCLAVGCAMTWWYIQSKWYYQDFRLGFNDFGHFVQRIANTAAGRGFLLETPVLPTFWDHFNPGLAMLVPAWWIWPNVYWIFALQSLSLALPALILASIVRKLGGSGGAACFWGLAWLLHPSIGQMNLAYTYGWHPVTVAVPLLLLAYRCLLSSRYLMSAMCVLCACTFEEGVIVVVGCFAAAMFLRTSIGSRLRIESIKADSWNEVLAARSWFALFLTALIAFVLVYKASGLATFQTGRFGRLGGSAGAILLSPILNPSAFWGLLFRPRNAVFLGLLLAPFVVFGKHLGRWHLLSVALPIGVLLVWEHLPAQSIAFQYAACLIPILFLGCVETNKQVAAPVPKSQNRPAACLAVGWVLSLFVGQMPWSQNSLIDVLGATYEITEIPPRLTGSEDNLWLAEQIVMVRRSQFQDAAMNLAVSPRVLATGRIAAHLVGLPDVETVGQYWQRERDLSKLDPSLASPLLRYDVLVLDFRERFQQTEEETIRVRDEAMRHGFWVEQSRYGISVLINKNMKKLTGP